MIQTRELHGLAALDAMFTRAKAQNRGAFLPYFPIGYPTYEDSLATIAAIADAGVDGFEIGLPFSDPIADGTDHPGGHASRAGEWHDGERLPRRRADIARPRH